MDRTCTVVLDCYTCTCTLYIVCTMYMYMYCTCNISTTANTRHKWHAFLMMTYFSCIAFKFICRLSLSLLVFSISLWRERCTCVKWLCKHMYMYEHVQYDCFGTVPVALVLRSLFQASLSIIIHVHVHCISIIIHIHVLVLITKQVFDSPSVSLSLSLSISHLFRQLVFALHFAIPYLSQFSILCLSSLPPYTLLIQFILQQEDITSQPCSHVLKTGM